MPNSITFNNQTVQNIAKLVRYKHFSCQSNICRYCFLQCCQYFLFCLCLGVGDTVGGGWRLVCGGRGATWTYCDATGVDDSADGRVPPQRWKNALFTQKRGLGGFGNHRRKQAHIQMTQFVLGSVSDDLWAAWGPLRSFIKALWTGETVEETWTQESTFQVL